TELQDENNAVGTYIAYKQMTGSEPASCTLTTSASTRFPTISYRISGAENPATQAPQIGTTATASSVNPDPPSSAAISVSKDYLFIAMCGSAGEQADDGTYCTAFPTNYTPSQRQKTFGTARTTPR